jgi:CRISPR/Cas system-associated protein Cas10 (large subunit of type III CRISPR-Cas system)
MPNTNKAKERANILRKRLNKIFLNSLLKKTRNNIILKGRKQKIRHFYKKYILLKSRNI